MIEIIKDSYVMGVVFTAVLTVINILLWLKVYHKFFDRKKAWATLITSIILVVFSWLGAILVFLSIYRKFKIYNDLHIK